MKYPVLLGFTAWALVQGSLVLAEDAATLTPTPVQAGRPHASSFDPHGALTAQKMIAVAHQHMVEGRLQEAMYSLTSAINRYPDNSQLHAVRGSLLLQQGLVTPAPQDLERSISLDPDNAEVLTNRAQAYRQFERYEEAIADLDRAITLSPSLLAAYFNRGAMRYVQGDLETARVDFDRCIAIDPHLPAPYFNRAAVLDALGQRPEAVRDLERFLQISSNNAWRQQARQLLDVWQGTTPEVIEPAQPSPHQ